MTEEEAKTKPCIGPETCGRKEYGEIYLEQNPPTDTIVAFDARQARNAAALRSRAPIIARFCIGSACMAWRGQGNDPLLREPQGFCGLAGKP